jgi:hypothetical protein
MYPKLRRVFSEAVVDFATLGEVLAFAASAH